MAAKRPKDKEEGAQMLDVKAILSSRAADALGVLVEIMQDGGQKPELRMKAAESILDRACGKAGAASGAEGAGAPLSVSFEGVLEEWSR